MTKYTGLIDGLRDLSQLKHDDFTIGNEAAEAIETLQARNKELEAELEKERMRVAACGVVALADTPDSAAMAREMHPDYYSASCGDVERRVDECIALRKERDALAAIVVQQREALEIIAGRRLCIDNLMGNVDIANQALAIDVSQADAILKKRDAEVLERAAKVCDSADKSTHPSDLGDELRRMADEREKQCQS